MKNVWQMLKQVYADWSDYEAPRLGAALAFYTVLSLARLVILMIAMVSLVFARCTAQHQILEQVKSLIGESGAATVRSMLEHAPKPSSGIIASTIAVITLLFGASGVFTELRSGLNKLWEVKTASGSGIGGGDQRAPVIVRHGARDRISHVGVAHHERSAGSFRALLGRRDRRQFSDLVCRDHTDVWADFKYIPDTKIEWRDVWVGAIATAFLFTVGKSLIGLYIGRASITSAYGQAGSLVAVMVWVYYSAQIFFLGAEFTHVYSQHRPP